MVADWHESFDRGEDAVMIAKRNVEVAEAERDGARSSQAGREARQPGDRGGRGPLRRRRPGHHPRQRPTSKTSTTASAGGSPRLTPRRVAWCWTASTPNGGCVSMPSTWSGSTPTNEAPALEHAYAVTTYSAQGIHGRPRLRHGRPLDGQAGALRRRLAQPRGDLPLRDAGGSGTPRGDRAGALPTCARASRISPKPPSGIAPSSPPTTWRRLRRCRPPS